MKLKQITKFSNLPQNHIPLKNRSEILERKYAMDRYSRCKDALKVKLTAPFLGLPLQSHQKETC